METRVCRRLLGVLLAVGLVVIRTLFLGEGMMSEDTLLTRALPELRLGGADARTERRSEVIGETEDRQVLIEADSECAIWAFDCVAEQCVGKHHLERLEDILMAFDNGLGLWTASPWYLGCCDPPIEKLEFRRCGLCFPGVMWRPDISGSAGSGPTGAGPMIPAP